MKKIFYLAITAAMFFTACKKQQIATSGTPMQQGEITGSDFNGSKATIAGLHLKESNDGLEFDYDLVIKEVADDKYETSMKIYGLRVNGKKPDGADKITIFGAVLALNTTKESKETPLSVELIVKDIKSLADGKVINFPSFSYKGDLAYEILDVHSTILLDGGSVQVYDRSSMSFCGVYLTITDPKIDLLRTNWDIQPNTGAMIGKDKGHETITRTIVYTNFALLFNGVKGSEKCNVEEDNTIFILPKGHTIVQDPELAKIKTEELSKDTYGYVTLVVTGDPDRAVNNVQYRPDPISANDPKDPKATIKLPVMEFKESHFNQKNGVRRFVSTRTWDAVYGKTPVKNKPTIDKRRVYHICYENELNF